MNHADIESALQIHRKRISEIQQQLSRWRADLHSLRRDVGIDKTLSRRSDILNEIRELDEKLKMAGKYLTYRVKSYKANR